MWRTTTTRTRASLRDRQSVYFYHDTVLPQEYNPAPPMNECICYTVTDHVTVEGVMAL